MTATGDHAIVIGESLASLTTAQAIAAHFSHLMRAVIPMPSRSTWITTSPTWGVRVADRDGGAVGDDRKLQLERLGVRRATGEHPPPSIYAQRHRTVMV